VPFRAEGTRKAKFVISKKGEFVSVELGDELDRIAGVPSQQHENAVKIQDEAHGGHGTVQHFGTWYAGCYYIRDRIAVNQHTTGTWRMVKCVVPNL
jgi:hypothetical protein